jgi:hypothetical protein
VAALTSGRRLLEKADESERVVNVNCELRKHFCVTLLRLMRSYNTLPLVPTDAVKVGTLEEYVRTHDLLA